MFQGSRDPGPTGPVLRPVHAPHSLYLGHTLLQPGNQLLLLLPEDSAQDGTALAVLVQQEEA